MKCDCKDKCLKCLIYIAMKTDVSIRYLCECGKVQTREEMKREYDFGYDQLCCTKCNNVLINDLHGVVHCIVLKNPTLGSI